MPTSDEDLDKLRNRADLLRSQVAEARMARETTQIEIANDVSKAQLEAEVARLEADLATENAATKRVLASLPKSQPIADAEAAMAAAAAQQNALKDQAAADKAAAKDANKAAGADPNYVAKEAAERATEQAKDQVVPTPAPSEPVVPDTQTAASDTSDSGGGKTTATAKTAAKKGS